MDMELPSVEGYGEAFKNLFASGRADMDILDRAVKRVLTAKFRMGLFEHPFALEGEELRRVFMNKKDKEISLQSAKESMVLIKNNGVLPIQKSSKKDCTDRTSRRQSEKVFRRIYAYVYDGIYLCNCQLDCRGQWK